MKPTKKTIRDLEAIIGQIEAWQSRNPEHDRDGAVAEAKSQLLRKLRELERQAARPTAAPEVDTTTTRLHKFVTDSEGTFCCRCGLKQGAPNQPCEDEFVLGGNAPAQARPVVDGELAAAARLVEAMQADSHLTVVLGGRYLNHEFDKWWVWGSGNPAQEFDNLAPALTALLGEREGGPQQ